MYEVNVTKNNQATDIPVKRATDVARLTLTHDVSGVDIRDGAKWSIALFRNGKFVAADPFSRQFIKQDRELARKLNRALRDVKKEYTNVSN